MKLERISKLKKMNSSESVMIPSIFALYFLLETAKGSPSKIPLCLRMRTLTKISLTPNGHPESPFWKGEGGRRTLAANDFLLKSKLF